MYKDTKNILPRFKSIYEKMEDFVPKNTSEYSIVQRYKRLSSYILEANSMNTIIYDTIDKEISIIEEYFYSRSIKSKLKSLLRK